VKVGANDVVGDGDGDREVDVVCGRSVELFLSLHHPSE
jgi:hypothetical protein